MQPPRELDRAARLGELCPNRRGEVLKVSHLDDGRLILAVDPDRVRAQGALDPPHDDPVLLADLRLCSIASPR
jgi:hypothetical protein